MIYRFHTIPIKILAGFFFLSFSLVEIHKLDLNPYGNTREPEEPEQSGKRTKLKDLNLPISKLTNKALVMKIMY